MDERFFNLIDAPWIKVLDHNEQVETVSLLDVFKNAHLYRGLSGEMEAQNACVLRFLLAVLYAVFVRQTINGDDHLIQNEDDAVDRWEALYQHGQFNHAVIEAYLRRHEDRFWLFHPVYPFYQVPLPMEELRTTNALIKPTKKSVPALVGELSESGNKTRLFAGRQDKNSLAPEEAARWLIYLQGYDAAPAGNPGKVETGYSIKGFGLGWLGQLGLVMVNGRNLFETLMYNLVLSSEHNTWENAQAAWEVTQPFNPDSLMDTEPVFPDNILSLYTQQFRLVFMERSDENQVTGFRLWSGRKLETKNAFLEPMTLRRKKEDDYYPQLHQPSRQLWRDFSALLSAGGDGKIQPGVLNWLTSLQEMEMIPDIIIQLTTVGMRYTNNTAVEDSFSDHLNVNLGLLSELGTAWQNRVIQAVAETNRRAQALGKLARSLDKASGGSDSVAKIQEVLDQAFFQLDSPFRDWLESIRPDDNMDEKTAEWTIISKRIIRQFGEALASGVDPSAFSGRTIKEDARSQKRLDQQIDDYLADGKAINWSPARNQTNTVDTRYTAPEALNSFLYAIK